MFLPTMASPDKEKKENMTGFEVIVVGYSRYLLSHMGKFLGRARVAVLEEPDVCDARGIEALAAAMPVNAQVIRWEYQGGRGAARLLELHTSLSGAEVVIPGVEYAVPFAAELADHLGLPGAGQEAARQLRDKFELRNTARSAGLVNPRYSLVASADGVKSFQESVGGACVLKPTSRQASVGVQILEPGDDVQQAWHRTVSSDEGYLVPKRGIESRFLVEKRVVGPEFSVELLVDAGRTVFANVTEKRVHPGRFPVETGHIVPAALDAPHQRSLVEDTEKLAGAMGFGAGVLHCEWIVSADGNVLIECAGRIPGDDIPGLIDLAYNFSFVESYVSILRGTGCTAPASPTQGAAIRFFLSSEELDTGRQRDQVLTIPGVVDFQAKEPIGTGGGDVYSSWDRCGYVVACATDGAKAEEITANLTA